MNMEKSKVYFTDFRAKLGEGLPMKLKRLLKKYKYPPEEAENALETVIYQCEQWSDNDSNEYSINESTQKYNFQQSYYSIAADEIHEGYNKKL